jgi:hypothetical protein
MSSYVLPRLVAPFADESFPGLMMRTAEQYRLRDPRLLLRRLRPPPLTLWSLCQQNPTTSFGQQMQTLLGLDKAVFERLSTWTPDVTTVSVLGVPVWRDLVRHATRAVCPACLTDSSHHRAAWLISALPVCATHGVWLQDRCAEPNCRKPLGWRGLGVHSCSEPTCRHDMRHAEVEYADEATLRGLRSLHGLLHGEGTPPLGMPIAAALRMAFVIGQSAYGLKRATRPPGFIKRESKRMPEIMDAGWRALDDWPHGFHRLLDHLRAGAATRKGGEGIRKSFGALPTCIHGWARASWGSPIGLAFAQYVDSKPDLAVSSRLVERYTPGAALKHRHVSLTQANRILGVCPGVMRAIAEQRGMFLMPPRGKGRPSRLSTEQVQEISEELQSFLMPEEMRRMVGVGHRVIDRLETAGLIQRVPQSDRLMESRCYSKSDVQRFVNSCIGEAKTISRSEAKTRSLVTLTRAIGISRSVVDLCRALASGRLKSAATVTKDRGLMKIRLRMEDVESVLPPSLETMSTQDAAPLMKAKHHHLNVWARRGFLATIETDRTFERRNRITGLEWERFRREYITGGEIADMAGQSQSSWLSRHLRFLEIEPVSGPGIDASDLFLFRRTDCTPEVIERVREMQAGRPGTGREKHRRAFTRAAEAAGVVAARWNTDFSRTNNRFVDGGGRILQVISGRRPDLTGTHRFKLHMTSLIRLKAAEKAWVALVPDVGDCILLVPLDRVPWRVGSQRAGYVLLQFDCHGRPLELQDWIVPFHAQDAA